LFLLFVRLNVKQKTPSATRKSSDEAHGEKSWKTPPRAGGVEWVGVLAARFAWWGKYPRSGSDALLCGTTALLSPGLQSGVSEANE